MFVRLEHQIEKETVKRLAEAQAGGFDVTKRGATWTYLTTDRPFGNISERIIRGLLRSMSIATIER
jgi:hypothetical protein